MKDIIYKIIRTFKSVRDKVYISRGSFIHPATEIGKYTRINSPSHIDKCKIGKCCAIAGRLIIRSSNHNYKFLNMNVVFQKKYLKSKSKIHGLFNREVTIGNGVWIGDSVIILPNVQVGDGAVIAAGSVVTKDVPPYAIFGGNPAKLIKFRFSEKVIERIIKLDIWNMNISEMQRNIDLFEKEYD